MAAKALLTKRRMLARRMEETNYKGDIGLASVYMTSTYNDGPDVGLETSRCAITTKMYIS